MITEKDVFSAMMDAAEEKTNEKKNNKEKQNVEKYNRIRNIRAYFYDSNGTLIVDCRENLDNAIEYLRGDEND